MKSIEDLVLCDWHGESVEVHVKAKIEDGELTLSWQDLGPYVEKTWGDSDYEYWYHLDRENTKKLMELIQGKEDPKAALLREFRGEGGCRALRELCEENGIKYEFSSYV